MGLTLPTATRNAACNAVVDLIDVGGAGTLEFKSAASVTAGASEVATITFAATAFGAAATGTATMASAPLSDTNATGGTVGHFTIFNNAGGNIMQGLVSTAGSDINMSSLVIGATDTVELTSLTITMPAS